MGTAFLIGAGVLFFGWAFKAGKREGSRKAFHAGREHAKRAWRHCFSKK
jgi:hypothetical protein